MKTARHAMILNLIKKYEVETQEELAEYLRQNKFHVTQATVSRDIKELRLIKTLSKDGVYKYDTGERNESGMIKRFLKIFAQSVVSIEYTGNLIVIHTLSGSANGAAEAIDAMELPSVIGTLAGDNTIFVACSENTDMKALSEHFSKLMR
ncbi:MAG: arginine repressor [Christensenellales bacterium]|jgi:transcriptional regulator of arginine metabolism